MLILSRPDYFEKCFIPFIKSQNFTENPVNRSIEQVLNENFSGAEKIYSYDLRPDGTPEIIMQKGNQKKIKIREIFICF